MKFRFLFKTSKIDGGSEPPPSPSWTWPSCNQPRTLSFRSGAGDIFKPDTSESASFDAGGEVTEAMIRDLRSSERLFFDPGETSPVLGGGTETASFCLMSVESRDPVADFRGSMEEMVEAHGPMGWAGLEELLRCYLKVNGAHNHDYIVGAFVDLLVNTTANVNNRGSSETTSRSRRRDSPVSTLSFYTSSESSSTSSTAITREIEEEHCSCV